MSLDSQGEGRVGDEAARWFARLNTVTVSTADLSAFRAWRQNPIHEAAYEEVERLWQGSAALRSDPDIQVAIEAAERSGRRAGFWSSPAGLGIGAAAACAACAVIVVGRPWQGLGGSTYMTAVGVRQDIALEDGSRVSLDTDSRIRVRYSAKRREIALEKGQAFFEVVHRPDRPFRVQAGATVIQDIGTRFDVRRDADQVKVTVVEGSVQVRPSSSAKPWTLTAGQQMATGSQTAAPHAVDPAKATSWTTGRLIFEALPLSAATAEMNRYGSHRISLQAPDVGQSKVNGAFDSADTAAFVAAVTHLYNLKAETQPDGSIVLKSEGGDHPS